MKEIPIPFRQFVKLNFKLMGPLPPSQGFHYLLTIMDRNTKWVEAVELEDINSNTVMDRFIKGWVSRYGIPVTIITDHGTQFTGDVWQRTCSQLHIHHRITTSISSAIKD